MRVDRISPSNERAALEYLGRSPYENAFVSYMVRYDLSSAARDRLYVASSGEEVCGVAYFGRQVALACGPQAARAFAERARRLGGERMILGPLASVQAYWEVVREWHPAPRAVRARQLVMAIDREHLRSYERTVTIRLARPDEWTAVADSSAMMIEGELEYDPRRTAPDFASNVREMIDRGLWWVGVWHGRLCFFANIGPWCDRTTQLQGIWTPPELRGRGLATSALAGICDHLLEDAPTLSLYVNDFNAAAIALYRRVGFETVSEYRTLLF